MRVDTIKLIPLEINTAALLTAVPKIVIPVAKTLNADPANNIPGLAAPNTKPAAPISAKGPGICDIFPTLESSISPFANGDIYDAAPAKPRAPKVNEIPANPRRDNPPARGTKPLPISAKGNPANITSDGVNNFKAYAAPIIAKEIKSKAAATTTIAAAAINAGVETKLKPNNASEIAANVPTANPTVGQFTPLIILNAYAKATIAPDTINIAPAAPAIDAKFHVASVVKANDIAHNVAAIDTPAAPILSQS